MGSGFSKQVCCVNCGTCKKQEVEEANEASETKPILQTLRETSMCTGRQPSSPVLKAFKEVQSLSQDPQSLADAAEEKVETCSAPDPMGMTEGQEAAWDSTRFLVAPAGGQTKGEVKILTQLDNQHGREKVDNTEEEIKPVPHASEAQPFTEAAEDAKPIADREQSDEQARSEGSPRAGITLQERSILDFIETANEKAGQGSEIKPAVENGESIIGGNLPLCSGQMAEETETYLSAEHREEMDGVKLPEISPPSTEEPERTSPIETSYPLTVQAIQNAREELHNLEVIISIMTKMDSAVGVLWDAYAEEQSLQPADQPLDFLQPETQSSVPTAQETESQHGAEPAELSEALSQSGSKNGVLGELPDGESLECDAENAAGEAEPQDETMQQTELPEELVTCVQMPVNQEAEFPTGAPLLSEVFESSGEKD